MYKSLQAGRAAAALAVVFFHIGGALGAAKYFGASSFSRVFSSGDSGVDFFFVLSGFIIVWIHSRDFGRPAMFLEYLRKRAVRIYPAYWIVFVVVYISAWSFSSLWATVPHDPLAVLKSLALIPQDKDVIGGTGAPVLIVAWSLQYEVIFYCAVAAFILNQYAGSLLCMIALPNMVYCQSTACTFPQSFFASDFLLLFAMGAAVARLCRSQIQLERPLRVALAGASGFALVVILETTCGKDFSVVDRRLLYGFFSAIVIWGAVKAEDNGTLRVQSRLVSVLGDSSYVLYLVHFPVISALCKLAVLAGLRGVSGAFVVFPVIVTACVAAAAIIHLRIERPILVRLAGSDRLRKRGG